MQVDPDEGGTFAAKWMILQCIVFVDSLLLSFPKKFVVVVKQCSINE